MVTLTRYRGRDFVWDPFCGSGTIPIEAALIARNIAPGIRRRFAFVWDPFCGSGTIPIEAALIARNIAPGIRRRFASEQFAWAPQELWNQVRTEAKDREFRGSYRILGSDNDPKSVSLAMSNARKAGVGDIIQFRDGDATKMSLPCDSGILICNPPYGQRMMEQRSAQQLYAALGRHLKYADGWSKYIITSEPEFEHYFGRRAKISSSSGTGMPPK